MGSSLMSAANNNDAGLTTGERRVSENRYAMFRLALCSQRLKPGFPVRRRRDGRLSDFKNLFQLAPHAIGIGIHASPILHPDNALVDEHA